MSVQFRILGPIEIEVHGEIVSPPGRRERCLLGVLLLEANRVVPVGRLADLLWEDNMPKRVRGAVQGRISRMRSMLNSMAHDGGVELVHTGDGYRMVVDPERIDSYRFRTLLERARMATDPADRIERLRSALDLWRGPALADALTESVRDRLCSDLEEQRLTATEDLIATSLMLRREREVLPELARIVSQHPGREKLVGLHMQALHQSGRRVEALDTFARVRVYLADEFGMDPGPELRELHQAILRDELTIPRTSSQEKLRRVAPEVVPRQLPVDVAGFAGRARQLQQLDDLLSETGGSGRSVVIATIDGSAGVGKTALAVHWAHRVADRFVDGQLYLNLRGFDTSGSPMDPAEAMRALLDGLEVPPQRIPASLDAQVGLYRTILAGRRTMVVLDNARDAEQVRPLLPGSPGCLALVTSRNRLAGLVAVEGAHSVTLDVLSPAEARQLFESRLGADRVAAEPDAINEIMSLCSYLPLAMATVAAHATSRRSYPLHAIAEELRDIGQRLDTLSDADPKADVRVVLSWSYLSLGRDAASLFRLLGLHPGSETGIPAAASLAGTSQRRARVLLSQLVAANLVIEYDSGRYTLHDLLRAYARELTQLRDSDDERRDAQHRVLDYYVHSAHAADRLVCPHRDPVPISAPMHGIPVSERFADDASALLWFVTEQRALLAAVQQAAACGFDMHAWDLAWALVGVLQRRAQWRDQIAVQETALDAARRIADPAMQARSHRCLGNDLNRLGQLVEARVHLQHALELHRRFKDPLSEGHTHYAVADLYEELRDHEHALMHAHQALELFRLAGYVNGQADTLNLIGISNKQLGKYHDARMWYRKAVAAARQIGSPAAEAAALNSLASVHHRLGRNRVAMWFFLRSIRLFRSIGHRYGEASSQDGLGDVYHAMGDSDLARSAWQRALSALDRLERPEAADVRMKLNGCALTDSG